MSSALGTRQAARAGLALVLANARYWTTVAPAARVQLARWERRAMAIPEPRLQQPATDKLRAERFNVEAAATLATLAPRAARAHAVKAIVALQVMYDYLDILTERPVAEELLEDPPRDGPLLLEALVDAMTQREEPPRDYYRHLPHIEDGGYLRELVQTVRRSLARLPATDAIATVARAAARRCAHAQLLNHAATGPSGEEMERWARRQAASSTLPWPEFLAGASASVLALHALIAAAADARTTHADVERIDTAYLSIGALTMLDSLIDRNQDIAAGERSYLRYYQNPQQMAQRLAGVARDAAERARTLPHAAHHVMTIAGVVAYYASARSAGSTLARAATRPLRSELKPLIAPTIALLRAWRMAKAVRRTARRALPAMLATVAATAYAAIGAAGVSGSGYPIQASTLHALKASDTARLRYLSASGSFLIEEGQATGTLPGSMRVHVSIGSTMSGSFTIYTRGGSITGRGSAIPHGSGVYESFAGSITVTGGSGRYAHAHGHSQLHGTFNRNTYALLVQTVGTLRY